MLRFTRLSCGFFGKDSNAYKSARSRSLSRSRLIVELSAAQPLIRLSRRLSRDRLEVRYATQRFQE